MQPAAAPSTRVEGIGWRLDLLMGGLAAVLIGSTVILGLHGWLLVGEELLLPAAESSALVDAHEVACDVLAAECQQPSGAGAALLALQLGLPEGQEARLALPLPPGIPCVNAPLVLYAAFKLEISSEGNAASHCVLGSDPAASGAALAVRIEVTQPPESAALVKFSLACAVTCTPCCVAVGLALALAAHPQAAGLAVMVEEKTRQSGLLPRCDFDARTLGGGAAAAGGAAAGAAAGELGKLV